MNLLIKQLEALIEGEENFTANASNASALLNQYFDEINWVGFYFYEEERDQLILGPFQGKPACLRIDPGKGVCGTAFVNQESIIVEDVNKFPGHIVCDAASQSEIVIPLIQEGEVIGVLDVDAPVKNRFNEEDRALLEEFADVFTKHHFALKNEI